MKYIKSEIKEDIECLKYFFKNGTLGGSTVRLARMCRMIIFITLFISVLTIIFVR